MTNSLHKSTQISSLINKIESGIECVSGDVNAEIASVEYNSRKAGNEALFVAVPGFAADGHAYINDAINMGAKAVLISKNKMQDFLSLKDNGIIILTAEDTRKALSAISAEFFGNPSCKVPVIGITGTNGKTSITYMIESVLRGHGFSPGVIGTINYRWKGKAIEAPNTTPESRDLQEIFANMISEGVDVIIMEVSSHALKLFRVEDIDFDIVIFTNLTRDHLDFHESFEDYFESKKRIFHLLEKSRKDNKAAIVNIDDEYGKKIFRETAGFNYPVMGFGMGNDADFKPAEKSIVSSINGVSYALEKPAGGIKIKLNIPGSFQIYNSLCAFAACYKMGVPVDVIQKGLSDLKTIPGRFDSIKSNTGFTVIVDYAHTDDAVHKLLASAKELNPKRIITLLGCGGNRDKSKRPLMGRTAVLNSDWVIFTSDNPRNEEPEDIIKDIVTGLSETNFEVISDREQAIKKAVFMAGKDEMIVIAGKGHEDYQIIKGKKIHFDDHELAKKYIEEREIH